MKYGDIVAILFVIMALYYVALIAMDLYKAKMTKESEKEKEKETEIDISDEVEGFKTIHVSREYPNGRLEANTKEEAEGEDNRRENEDIHSSFGIPHEPAEPTKPKEPVRIPESQLQAIRSIRNRSEERIHQHKVEHQSKASYVKDPVQNVVTDSQSEKQDVQVEHEVRKTDPATRPGYRPPNMIGGMSIEEVVSVARRRSMGDDKAMAGIIHTCEAA